MGLGVDSEPWATFTSASDSFLARNFTEQERQYCKESDRGEAASLAGKWCAKEAALKALCNLFPDRPIASSSQAAPLKEIVVGKSKSGAPHIELTGSLAKEAGQVTFKASITHVHNMSTATVIATNTKESLPKQA